jgi:hypothetical protein
MAKVKREALDYISKALTGESEWLKVKAKTLIDEVKTKAGRENIKWFASFRWNLASDIVKML